MRRLIDWLSRPFYTCWNYWIIETIALIKTARERTLVSYGVTDETGGMFFVEAHRFTMDGGGRLLFWKRGWLSRRVIAVVEAGKWQRVLKGISLEDFEE